MYCYININDYFFRCTNYYANQRRLLCSLPLKFKESSSWEWHWASIRRSLGVPGHGSPWKFLYDKATVHSLFPTQAWTYVNQVSSCFNAYEDNSSTCACVWFCEYMKVCILTKLVILLIMLKRYAKDLRNKLLDRKGIFDVLF